MRSALDISEPNTQDSGGATTGVFPPFALAPAVLICLNVLLFGTFQVYVGNPGEFLVPYREAFTILLLPFLALLGILIVLGRALGRRRAPTYNGVLIFLALASYIHGNLLRWDTGILDGSALDLSNGWRSLADVAIWLLLGWLCWRYRRWLAVGGWRLCVMLALFQIIGIAAQAQNRTVTPPGVEPLPAQLVQLSSETNIIHVVLDGFQANVFESLLESDAVLRDELQGFTFFRDAVAPSEVTYLSVPATLSGKVFTNNTTISDYHEQTLRSDNLYTVLAANDYSIDVATPVWWNSSSEVFSSYYRIPTPYTDRPGLSTASFLVDVSLFRQAPHFLKSLVYGKGTWLLSDALGREPGQHFQHVAHNEFLRQVIARLEVGSAQPRYKFLHLVTPHAPLVTSSDCGHAGRELAYSMESSSDQSRCTLATVRALLRRLKVLGAYGEALLIIHGDHGGGVPFPMRGPGGQATDSAAALTGVWGNALPLVLIKPPGSTGGLRVSNAPVSLPDVPATVAGLVGVKHEFPGQSMYGLAAGQVRVRHYYTSPIHRNEAAAKDHFDSFRSFSIQGSVYDVAAWSEADLQQTPTAGESADYLWGTWLSFGKNGNFKPFQDGGWAMTTSGEISWTEGHQMGLSLPLAAPTGAVRMSVRLKPLLAAGKLERQRVSISVNGRAVAQWQLTHDDFQDLELLIPRTFFAGEGNTRIRFELPDARAPADLGIGLDKRTIALAFLHLRFDDTGVNPG